MRVKAKIAILLFAIVQATLFGQIQLPKLISDGMVLQRNTELKIWGWASPNERVEISFVNKRYHTKADNKGNWELLLDRNAAGGPYEMGIYGNDTVVVKDILFGDVWLCSGQSNMQLPMRRIAVLYGDEIANSENKHIRQFAVPVQWNYTEPQNDFKGGKWQMANPETIMNFSGVAYFFARDLYAKYKVPIGILLTAAGGSCAEGWISEETLKQFPEQYSIVEPLKDSTYLQNLVQTEKESVHNWFSQLATNDQGYKGIPFTSKHLDDSEWETVQVPCRFNKDPISLENGAVWFRKELTLSKSFEGKTGLLELGRIVDSDSAFINGTFIGTTSYQYPPRRYTIPEGILKEGKNTLTVKVISQSGSGAFIEDKPYKLRVADKSIDLTGPWKYKIGAIATECPSSTFFPGLPLGPFNAMFNPLINYNVKGVVWYQGESNTGRPDNYFEVVSTLIDEWRMLKKDEKLPLICVQLPNFMEEKSEPTESNWAKLRNQQLKLHSLPNVYTVTTIDLGEWNDLHPLRKKEVGERVALMAMNKVYGEEGVVCTGPEYESMKVVGDKIELTFELSGSNIAIRDGDELAYFAIAGSDKKFIWANARIEGNKVIVWSGRVSNPLAVRYAWANNPESANLYNIEGLPASPFRTDNW